jgi:serine/threonine protein kinase
MAVERDLSGTVLAGRYRVLQQIGGGGMGTVHAGEHLEVGRKVAIKILLPESVNRPDLVERFRREARVTARIEHEHVVECLDIGVTADNLCFHVMEWLRGEDLHMLLRRVRTLPWPRVRSIVTQVCRAVAAAHERGVIHRDLKPGNIFLVRREDNPDFVKVLDFGIAKLTGADEVHAEVLTRIGEVLGTTPYMAPEMAAGEPFDHRIDVYAVGVILFQALSGRLPFRAKTPRQLLTQILTGDIPDLSERNPQLVVSPALEALLRRALHRDVQQRFPDMAALHEALMELPDDACITADAVGTGPDPSASESAMAVSVLGPMQAGDGSTPRPDTRPTVFDGPRPVEQSTVLEPPPVARRRRGRLVLAGLAALISGALAWTLWPYVGAIGGPGAGVDAAIEATNDPVIEVKNDPVIEANDPVIEAKNEPVIEAKHEPVIAEHDSGGDPPLAPLVNRADDPVIAPPGPEESRTPDAPAEAKKARDGRSDFDDVMRKAGAKVRRCLAQGGLKDGTKVRFDIVVEARTGRITSATPRAPHDRQAALGGCVVEAARGATVRPAPANEWHRTHEFTT